MLEPALVAYLREHVPSVGSRVHPGVLPDPPVLPAITYTRVSTRRPVTYDGPHGFVRTRMQLDVWAPSRSQARAVADELRRALLGYRGRMGETEVAIPEQSIDEDLDEPEDGLARVMTEFIIWHEED